MSNYAIHIHELPDTTGARQEIIVGEERTLTFASPVPPEIETLRAPFGAATKIRVDERVGGRVHLTVTVPGSYVFLARAAGTARPIELVAFARAALESKRWPLSTAGGAVGPSHEPGQIRRVLRALANDRDVMSDGVADALTEQHPIPSGVDFTAYGA
jgi:hypothetical protein